MAGEAAPMDDGTLFQLREVIWDGLEGDDVGRWFRQEFKYSANEGTTFGLRQRSGGPCGVLAAVQGYILAKLLFGCSLCELRDVVEKGSSGTLAASTDPSKMLAPSPEALTGALSHALTFLCWQAGDMKGCRIVMAADEGALPLGVDTPAAALTVFAFDDFAEAEAFLCSILPQFETPSGVALLMYSVLLSRGLERVRADADEPTPLVARFGHCSQELLNLLLTGEATSGIFDGVQSLGGEDMGFPADAAAAASGAPAPAPDVLCLKGVSRRPLIGYLSHVEAMRYGKVGEFYKSPLVPVWVVGSESHFSLLFGSDPAVNEESPSAGVYRAFKKYDAHDNQFIPVDKFPAVLSDLGLPLAADKTKAAAVGKQLDTGSMGFVVWSDFWMAVSQLQAGVDADTAVAAVRAVHGLTSTGAGAGAAAAGAGGAAGAGSAAPAPAAAPYSGPPMSFEDLSSLLRAAFEQHDDMEAGFVLASKLPSVIHTAVPHLPHGFKLTEAEIGQLAGRLTAGQDPAQAIILFDDLLREATPLLKRLAAASAKPAPTPAPAPAPAAAPVAAGAGSSAPAAAAGSSGVPAVGSKRPRSDSDLAREVQRQLDEEASASVVRGAGGGPATVPPSSESGTSAAAATGGAPDVIVLDAAGSIVSGAPAAAAGVGAGAAAAGAGASAGAGAAAVGAGGGDKVRRFHLYHYNGLEDGGRRPRCVKLTVKQSDSGLAPVSAHQDAIAAHALARGASVSGAGAGGSGASGSGASGGGGSIEDDMAAALALSVMEADAAEAAAIAASMETDTSAGSASAAERGPVSTTAATEASGAEAAAAPASTEAASTAAGEGVDAADAAAIAAVRKADTAAAAGVGPLEGIIRTKWPAAAVSCEGPPPSID